MPVLYRTVTRPLVNAVPARALHAHPSLGSSALCVRDLAQSFLPNVRYCCPTKAHSLRLAFPPQRNVGSLMPWLVGVSAMRVVICRCRLHVNQSLEEEGICWAATVSAAFVCVIACQTPSKGLSGERGVSRTVAAPSPARCRSPDRCMFAKAIMANAGDGGRIKLPSWASDVQFCRPPVTTGSSARGERSTADSPAGCTATVSHKADSRFVVEVEAQHEKKTARQAYSSFVAWARQQPQHDASEGNVNCGIDIGHQYAFPTGHHISIRALRRIRLIRAQLPDEETHVPSDERPSVCVLRGIERLFRICKGGRTTLI